MFYISGFDVLLIYQHLGGQASRETRGMIYFSREASNSHELTMPLLGVSKGDGFGRRHFQMGSVWI